MQNLNKLGCPGSKEEREEGKLGGINLVGLYEMRFPLALPGHPIRH